MHCTGSILSLIQVTRLHCLAVLCGRILECNDARAGLEDDVKELNEANAGLEDDVKELNEANAGLEDDVKELNEANAGLEDDVKKLNEANAGLEDDVKELNEANAGLHDEVKELESEIEQLKNEAKGIHVRIFHDRDLVIGAIGCAASEAAVRISCTGKISIRLTASFCNETTMPHALATMMLCDGLHMTRSARLLSHTKEASHSSFYGFWKWHFGKLTKTFGCKRAAITVCWYTSSTSSVGMDRSFFLSLSAIRYVLAKPAANCDAACETVGLKCVVNGFDGQDVKKVYESIGRTCSQETVYVWGDQPCITDTGICYGTTKLPAHIDCAPAHNGAVRRLCPCA